MKAKELDDTKAQADYYRDSILPLMAEARSSADMLELRTGEKYWPFPTYEKLLFYV